MLRLKPRFALTIVLATVSLSRPGTAQDDLVNRGFEGIRESATLFGAVSGGLPAAFLPKALTLRILPTGAAASGQYVWGASGFVVARTATGYFASRPLEVGVGYRRIDLTDETLEDRDRLIATLKNPVVPTGGRVEAAAFGEYAKTFDLQNSWKAGVATAYLLNKPAAGNPDFLLGITAGFAGKDPNAGESIDDVTLSTGLEYRRTSETRFKLDYAFKNDITGQDDFSFVIQQVITPTLMARPVTVVAGAGKHRVLILSFVATF